MSDPALGVRAGQIHCICPDPAVPDDDLATWEAPGIAPLAAGFACSVLSQVLGISALPLAGALVAPDKALATWPVAAMLAGAAVATLPATLLRDAFGRRAGFALGASLGIAGGLIAAWALVAHQFAGLVIGAFWLGIAQGFGLFYRHEAAALAPRGGASSAAIVFAAGGLAGLVAPLAARGAESLGAPHLFAGTLVVAALAHVASLAFAARLPPWRLPRPAADVATSLAWRKLVAPTLMGAVAWFAMSRLMAVSPLALAGCGISFDGVAGLVSWHVVAMYAPALAAAPLLRLFGPNRLALAGLALVLAGAFAQVPGGAQSPVLIAGGLALVGIGWCLATLGATVSVNRLAPSRAMLAVHDGTLLAASLLGALALGQSSF